MAESESKEMIRSRAWYESDTGSFRRADVDSILGSLVRNSTFTVTSEQRDAWLEQVVHLREVLRDVDG